ncbi:hypothetical protein FB45DRAFT_1103116 [Roridomyces roridus]|uniref:Uncharacterized protein n=1 Tax=Roridomyces roridus TaxID=1738132 RepID=A0AAD7FDM8_9AGAR|nr:hypothetical protein FB45DRAFT_1103116 [Roridomyces roridus]
MVETLLRIFMPMWLPRFVEMYAGLELCIHPRLAFDLSRVPTTRIRWLSPTLIPALLDNVAPNGVGFYIDPLDGRAADFDLGLRHLRWCACRQVGCACCAEFREFGYDLYDEEKLDAEFAEAFERMEEVLREKQNYITKKMLKDGQTSSHDTALVVNRTARA